MPARHRPRRVAATALVVLGTFSALVGGVLLYARQEVVNPHAFAAHASHALKDENVRAAIGDAVLDQVTRSGPPDLLSFRPALESVLDGVIGSPPFRALFVGRELLLDNFADDTDSLRSSVAAVWDSFLGGLHTWALLVGAFGLVVAAAASSVLGYQLRAGTPAQRAWRLVSRVPERTAL